MEDLFDYLPLLLFVWVILRALRGAGRKQPAQRPQPPALAGSPRNAPRPATPFEELMRRIEEAAAEAARQNAEVVRQHTEAAVPAKPPPPPLTTRLARPPAPPRPRPDDEFRPAYDGTPAFRFVGGPGEPYQPTEFHETHPLERAPAPSAQGPGRRPLEALPTRAPHPLIARLRAPESAAEALLLTAVLGRPHARRS